MGSCVFGIVDLLLVKNAEPRLLPRQAGLLLSYRVPALTTVVLRLDTGVCLPHEHNSNFCSFFPVKESSRADAHHYRVIRICVINRPK